MSTIRSQWHSVYRYSCEHANHVVQTQIGAFPVCESAGSPTASLRLTALPVSVVSISPRQVPQASTPCPQYAARHCSHDACTTVASFNVKGSKKAAYCKLHAEDGMVNVHHDPCSHDACTKRPSFNIKGSKKALYCRKHAENDMVDVRSKRCSYESCSRRPDFNFEGSKGAAYCRQHAEEGMVSFRSNRCCSHDTCTTVPSYNIEGSKKAHAVYCKKHAEDGMVDVVHTRCKHDSCTTIPSLPRSTSSAFVELSLPSPYDAHREVPNFVVGDRSSFCACWPRLAS